MYKLTGTAFAAVAAACFMSATAYGQSDTQTTVTITEVSETVELPDREVSDKKFGTKGQLVLSAERMTGLSIVVTTKFEADDVRNRSGSTTTSFSLFGSSSGFNILPVALPRISLDGFLGDGISLGGAILGDYSSTSNDGGSAWFSGLNLRGGVVMDLTDIAVFWPKAGLTFAYGDAKDGAGKSYLKNYLLSVDLSLAIMFEVVEHFGLTVAPSADLPLMTRTSLDGGDFNNSASIWNFGVMGGMLGWF